MRTSSFLILSVALSGPAAPLPAQNSLSGLENFTLEPQSPSRPAPVATETSTPNPTSVPTPPPTLVPTPVATPTVGPVRVEKPAPARTERPAAADTPPARDAPQPRAPDAAPDQSAATPAGAGSNPSFDPAPAGTMAEPVPPPATAGDGAEGASRDWPVWGAIAVAVLALLALVLWRRGRGRGQAREAEGASVSAGEQDVRDIGPAQPTAPPAASVAPPPVTAARPGGLVTSALKPDLRIGLKPVRGGVDALRATLEYELQVSNAGRGVARAVTLEAWLTSAGHQTQGDLAALFASADGTPMYPPFDLSGSAAIDLAGEGIVARDALATITAGERRMFVPVLAVRARFLDTRGSPQAVTAAFMIGVEQDGQARLAPLPLDRGSRMSDRLVARPFVA